MIPTGVHVPSHPEAPSHRREMLHALSARPSGTPRILVTVQSLYRALSKKGGAADESIDDRDDDRGTVETRRNTPEIGSHDVPLDDDYWL